MGRKEEKQFPLTSKDNCAIYLNRIISSCELCMYRLKKYNIEGKNLLIEYTGKSLIPHEVEDETQELLKEFNKMRNWQNHIPESLLVAEMEQVEAEKMVFPMDPVDIIIYKNVTYEYFENMIEINLSFYDSARKIIQAAKRDYKSVYGKSVMYNRIYVDKPLDFDKSEPTQKSAKVQGIKGNIGLKSEIEAGK